MKKLTYIIFPLLFLCSASIAQNLVTIKVKTKDLQQNLPGALVKITKPSLSKGTNENGEVFFDLPEGNYQFTISFVGYQPNVIEIKLPVDKPGEVLVWMENSLTDLEIVTVSTGYEPVKSERLVGSASVVDEKLLNRSVGTNVLDRLKDIVPGLIFNKSGNASANPISIRGQTSIVSSSMPLIVLDNFPFSGDLNSINPNDIESISVLKDAAAASIWGARAANGVIVITSKAGRRDTKPKFSFSLNHDIGEKPDLNYSPKLSTADFIDIEKLLFQRGYYTATENSASKEALSPVVELLIAKRDGKLSPAVADAQIENFKQYDIRKEYQDLLSRGARNTQLALAVSGGSEQNTYYIGTGIDRNKMNDIGNQSTRYSFNARNKISFFKDKLSAEFIVRYANGQLTQNNPGFSSILMNNSTSIYPYARLTDDFGNPASVVKDYRSAFISDLPAGFLDWSYRPLDEINNSDNKITTINYSAQANLGYRILDGLEARMIYQYAAENIRTSYLQGENSYFTRNMINRLTKVNPDNSLTRPIPLGGILDWSNGNAISQNLRGQISYNKVFDTKHSITLFAGSELSERNSRNNATRFYGYDSEHAISMPVDYKSGFTLFNAPTSTNNLIPYRDFSTILLDRFVSYFVNASYAYQNKYLFNGSARIDKSNIFGVNTNQKAVPLWSLGLGWVISEEGYFDKGLFSFLKMRLSYGYNGNLDKSFSAYTTASFRASAVGTALPFAQIDNPPNPELRWERISTLNAGVDFGVKDGLLSGSIDFYSKKGTDILGQNPFPASSGITTFFGNIANTQVSGLDITLFGKVKLGELIWQPALLYSYARERVSKYNLKASGSSYVSNQGVPMEGRPLFGIYYYPSAGLDPLTGDPRGYLKGEVSKDYSAIIAGYFAENIPFAGSARPAHFGAFRNTFSYKNISLSANISYRMGYYFRKPSVIYNNILTAKSGHIDYLSRWKSPGDERFTTIPSLPLVSNPSRDSFYQYSWESVQKGDHIRLQDLRLDYSFNQLNLLKKLNISGATFFIYAQNLGIIWRANKFSLDPDFIESQPLKSVALGVQFTL